MHDACMHAAAPCDLRWTHSLRIISVFLLLLLTGKFQDYPPGTMSLFIQLEPRAPLGGQKKNRILIRALPHIKPKRIKESNKGTVGALELVSLRLSDLSSCCGGLLPSWDSTLFTGIARNRCGTSVLPLWNAADAAAEQSFDGLEEPAYPFRVRIAVESRVAPALQRCRVHWNGKSLATVLPRAEAPSSR